MLKVAVLASSSAGNSTFVTDGESRLLIDAGLCLAETSQRLKMIREDPDTIDAVFVTHPHSDHIEGLKTLLSYWRRGGRVVEVYCSQSTHDALPGVIPPHWYRKVTQDSLWQVGKLHCGSFPVVHDTEEPLGFTCASGPFRAAFALDLGEIGDELGDFLADSDLVFLESNHDPDMLAAGPYSYKLKERIAKTHLSNEQACAWIAEHMTHRTKHLLLGHLSASTNDPEIVRLMAQRELKRLELPAALGVILPGAPQPSVRVMEEPEPDPDKE